MNIVYIIQNLVHGGAETQLTAIAKEQKKFGHNILVLTLFKPDLYFRELLTDFGIEVQYFDVKSLLNFGSVVFGMRKAIKCFDADVVHSHMYHSNIIARLIYKTYKKPKYICTAHNIREGGKFRDFLYRLTDHLCHVTTNVSQAAVDRYNADGLVKNSACRLVANGVDIERFRFSDDYRQELRGELKLEETFVWLAIASLTEQKDFPNMLHAFKTVAESQADVQLLVAGSGPEQEHIEQLIRELQLDGRVRLLGPRYDTEKIILHG